MDEQTYRRAQRNYLNAHQHHESLRLKQRRSQKQVNRLETELGQQQSKLQKLNEDLVLAVEKLRLAKVVYGPLREQWKKSHPKEKHDESQPQETHSPDRG